MLLLIATAVAAAVGLLRCCDCCGGSTRCLAATDDVGTRIIVIVGASLVAYRGCNLGRDGDGIGNRTTRAVLLPVVVVVVVFIGVAVLLL